MKSKKFKKKITGMAEEQNKNDRNLISKNQSDSMYD